jgi:hypothetical protein
MNEGTRSGKSTIRLLDISAERPTNGLYLYLTIMKMYAFEIELAFIAFTQWQTGFAFMLFNPSQRDIYRNSK